MTVLSGNRKATAGPSTAHAAKCATCSVQDDNYVGGAKPHPCDPTHSATDAEWMGHPDAESYLVLLKASDCWLRASGVTVPLMKRMR
jgi:hypothetical protein